MTLKQWRRLMWTSLVILSLAGDLPLVIPWLAGDLPPEVKEAAVARLDDNLRHLLLLVGVPLIGIYFWGLIGMFRCWRHAPYVFIGSLVCEAALVSAVGLPASSGWEGMLNTLGVIMSGVVFALAAFGPASHLFGRRH